MNIYIVYFSSGDEWPTWADSAKHAIELAKDAVPSLEPVDAVLDCMHQDSENGICNDCGIEVKWFKGE